MHSKVSILFLAFLCPCCYSFRVANFHAKSLAPSASLRHRPSKQHFSSLILYQTAAISAESENDNLPVLKRKLTKEFLNIGGPALIQLAAEPIAALVDTAYLGRLGPEVLGGAGVAVSAQYAVSKLYNDPLLRTSISLVASQDGKIQKQ